MREVILLNYKRYQNVRDLSWKILIQENITELPINVIAICRQMGIAVKNDDSLTENDGATAIVNGEPIILTKNEISIPRKRFTVAHEIGHIMLKHVGQYELINREPGSNDNPIEREANMFAARLLAPACVLWGCNVKTAAEIEKLCGISKQAAEYRMAHMRELYARNKFLISPLERQVYNQFHDFIYFNSRTP